MVFGVIGALATDTVGHIAGEAPLINAEKEFDRFMKSYEFAMEQQKLKREDVKNLMELIVQRMDMYHLIGALLLEFCVGFYGEFKLLEEDYQNEPKLIMEIFLLSNIAAVGYLLFAIWLSLHASVAAHAIGVELLLDHTRLTIPTPDNLRQMRQSTSLFRQLYKLFLPPPTGQAAAAEEAKTCLEDNLELQAAEVDPLSLDALETVGHGVLPPRLQNALHKMEHRVKFAQSHRSWLRFDAYSRVSMALGINQMLQSMAYFIAGPVQKDRPSFALVSVIGIQAIAFFLLKLDLRTLDNIEKDEEEGTRGTSKKNRCDVSRMPTGELMAIFCCYLFPPIWMLFVLWIGHFWGIEGRLAARVITTPIFFLHASWLYLVRHNVAPHKNDMLPVRLRTVGYLDVFTRDAPREDNEDSDEEEPDSLDSIGRQVHHSYAALKTVTFCDGLEDADMSWEQSYLESVTPNRRGTRKSAVPKKEATAESSKVPSKPQKMKKERQKLLLPQKPNDTDEEEEDHSHPRNLVFVSGAGRCSTTDKHKRKHALHGHDHVAWLVVGRFTTVMIWLWLAGGFLHVINCLLDVEGVSTDVNGPYHADEESLVEKDSTFLGERRRLQAQWPEPANFFEITAMQCNASDIVVSSPFSLHAARRLVHEPAIGPVAQISRHGSAAVLCNSTGTCDALTRNEQSGSWQLLPLAPRGTKSPVAAAVPIPLDWRIASAAWVPCSPQPCQAALIAAFDGRRVVLADLVREGTSAWDLQRRFTLHEGLGSCKASGSSTRKVDETYSGVRDLYLDVGQGCQTLAVLRGDDSGEFVDGWDLRSGSHLGCWEVGQKGSYSAMCHDGSDIILARHSVRGPVLETAPLPKAFKQCRRSRMSPDIRGNTSLAVLPSSL